MNLHNSNRIDSCLYMINIFLLYCSTWLSIWRPFLPIMLLHCADVCSIHFFNLNAKVSGRFQVGGDVSQGETKIKRLTIQKSLWKDIVYFFRCHVFTVKLFGVLQNSTRNQSVVKITVAGPEHTSCTPRAHLVHALTQTGPDLVSGE